MLLVWHVICPGLFMILQFLQSVVLQKLKPCSLAKVPVGLGFRFEDRAALGSIALEFSKSLVRNWSILSCLTPGAISSCLVVACLVTFGVVRLGLHFSSPALSGIAALTTVLLGNLAGGNACLI